MIFGSTMGHLLKNAAGRAGFAWSDIAAARMYCERHTLACFRRAPRRRGGRILCYHSVGQPRMGVNDVTPEQFRRQIAFARSKGYRFVPASVIARTGGDAMDLAITFDDGLKSSLTNAGPVLRDYDIPWSQFVVTRWSDQVEDWTKDAVLGWRDIELLAADGVEIGSHSVTHPDFGKIGISQAIDELWRSRRDIERRLGFAPTTFAIPLGQSMNWPQPVQQAARDIGYELIYAQAEETRPRDTIGRTFVTCFDHDRIFAALLRGAYDRWEEWTL